MGKDNNKSNSDLIQRLKTLLAESDQRPSSQPEETNQEHVEEAIQDLPKNQPDAQQNLPPEEIEIYQDIQEETARDISISEFEIQQSTPPENVNQDIQEETVQDNPINEIELQQSAPPEEVDQDIQEVTVQYRQPPPEEIMQKSPEEVNRDFKSSGPEVRQDESLKKVEQEPLEKNEVNDLFKNKLREGVNMPQVGNYVVNYKNIVVKTSDGSVISGKTNIDAFGRLTEYLKQGTDKFITVFSEDAGDASKQVTIVNKDHIIWANTWD